MSAPGFWDDQQAAARISSDHARLARRVERYESFDASVVTWSELLKLASSDAELSELEAGVAALRRQLERLQEDALFQR